MRRLTIAVLLCVCGAFAQTAKFPGAVVTDSDLTVVRNRVSTALLSPVTAAQTTFAVVSGTDIAANMLLTIDSEVVFVCSVAGNLVSVGKGSCPNIDGRGFDGTSAASHATNARVSAFVNAWHHNALAAEVKAIETALGANLSQQSVSMVGGSTAEEVDAATVLANNATNANTASSIVKRDGSGNFSAGTITANLTGNATNFTSSLAGDVTGTQGATVVSGVGGSSAANVHAAELLANAATDANTPSTIVKRSAGGNFTAGTITASLVGNATGFTGNLAGDVTGPQGTTVVASVGGQTAANVAAGAVLANAATDANTTSAIIRRAANGSVNISPGGTALAVAKYTVPYTTTIFTSNSGSADVTLFALPARAKVCGVTIKHSAQFTDGAGAMTDVSVSVGDGSNHTAYSAAQSIGEVTAVAATAFLDTAQWKSTTMAGSNVVAHFIATARNFGDGGSTYLTGGSVDIDVCWVALP